MMRTMIRQLFTAFVLVLALSAPSMAETPWWAQEHGLHRCKAYSNGLNCTQAMSAAYVATIRINDEWLRAWNESSLSESEKIHALNTGAIEICKMDHEEQWSIHHYGRGCHCWR